MRKFVRHPSDIPIEVVAKGRVEITEKSTAKGRKSAKTQLNNVSYGGMSCEVADQIPVGSIIDISISAVQPQYHGRGVVVWCRAKKKGYAVGIQFMEAEEAFKSRMVEQVCQIERYKRRVLQIEGREIDGEQAAREWIAKYASDF